MDELKNNPQIIELLETLEENGMHKEKGEVSALVSYIGDMEHTLSAMLVEMQEMRKEVNMIHNSSVKAKCETLIRTADGKIRQGVAAVSKAKNNLIASAANAMKAFREKGKEALKKVVSSIFRKKVCGVWQEQSQPATEVSSGATSRCFMFMYFLLPH